MNLFERNAFYITPEQQECLRDTRIFFGGAGLGSVIAECLVRLGFQHLVLCDGDTVELSNLNRQNYTRDQTGRPKTESLSERLLAINPALKLEIHSVFLTPDNMPSLLQNCDVAINAIDFDDGVSARMFDALCQAKGIPVLHPFNFGWAGCLYVVTPESPQLFSLDAGDGRYELAIARHTLNWLHEHTQTDTRWIEAFIHEYLQHPGMPPSQLAPGSWITAGLTANAAFCLAQSIPLKLFPHPYFLSARG